MSKRVDAPLEKVWEAWTDDEIIVKWFSPHANIEPELGGAYELFFDPEDHSHMSTIGCRVTRVEPMKKLFFQWKGPDQYAEFMNYPEPVTSVEVTFKESCGKTKVTMKHLGWGEGDEWAEACDWHVKAWEGVLDSLVKYFSQ